MPSLLGGEEGGEAGTCGAGDAAPTAAVTFGDAVFLDGTGASGSAAHSTEAGPSSTDSTGGKARCKRSATCARNSEANPGSPQHERLVAWQCQNSEPDAGSTWGPVQTLRERVISSMNVLRLLPNMVPTSATAFGSCRQCNIKQARSANCLSNGGVSVDSPLSVMYSTYPLSPSTLMKPGGRGHRRRQLASHASSGYSSMIDTAASSVTGKS